MENKNLEIVDKTTMKQLAKEISFLDSSVLSKVEVLIQQLNDPHKGIIPYADSIYKNLTVLNAQMKIKNELFVAQINKSNQNLSKDLDETLVNFQALFKNSDNLNKNFEGIKKEFEAAANNFQTVLYEELNLNRNFFLAEMKANSDKAFKDLAELQKLNNTTHKSIKETNNQMNSFSLNFKSSIIELRRENSDMVKIMATSQRRVLIFTNLFFSTVAGIAGFLIKSFI